MASHSFSVLPNDKEPGFTVASAQDVLTIHQQILARPCSEEVDPDLWIEAVMLKEYRLLCGQVAKAEGNLGLSSMLLRSVRTVRGEIPARLALTCKSTKVPVDFRNVHASASNWWAGLSAWLARVLERSVIKDGAFAEGQSSASV